MIGKYAVRITGVAKQKVKLYSILGITLALIQVLASQLYGQNSTMPAQQKSDGTPKVEEFEVATIKPGSLDANGGRHMSLSIYPNGRVKITNWPLKNLICTAYGLSYWQVNNGPAWIEKDFFDVEAKPEDPTAGAPAYNVHHENWSLDDPKLRSMLQALLEDRFQLKTHLAVKDGPVRVLERSDEQLSLTPPKHPSSYGSLGGIGFINGVSLLNTTMPQLTAFLGRLFDETVIDKTGLAGSYDFRSKTVLTPEDFLGTTKGDQPIDPNIILTYFLPTLKEMGLKLTRSTGPVTTLVVDQAAHPSPN